MKTRRNQPEHTHAHIQKGITCFLFLFLFNRLIPNSLHGRAERESAKWIERWKKMRNKKKHTHTHNNTFTYVRGVHVRTTTRNFMFNFDEENNYFSTSHHFGYSISIHRIVYFFSSDFIDINRTFAILFNLTKRFVFFHHSFLIWQ